MNILDILYPKHCVNCKKSGKYLCENCMKKMSYSRSICYKCRAFSPKGKTHSYCQKYFYLDGIYCVWAYQGVIGQAIKKLKYQFVADLAEELTEQFVLKYEQKPLSLNAPILVPIPLHPSRQRWRGFNQSELLGKAIAKKLNWDFEPNLLFRTRHTQPQVDLDGKQRKENVKNVFSLNAKATLADTIIIFDDVATTGSTLHEAAKVLKRNGTKVVWGMTIAS